MIQLFIGGYMRIIGRESSVALLEECLSSDRPEFLVLYGRRRVGKTFLIKEYFDGNFSFYATGVPGSKTSDQLKFFQQNLLEYGCTEKNAPRDWLEAFMRLRHLLESPDARKDPVSGKKVVFLDELPWMDTARSDFKSALDYFWNSWASSRKDLLLIVCGSAASWIIKHILADTGGFYNRATRILHLKPFTLKECEDFFSANGISLSRTQILESYMIFGGIPYYLNCYNRRFSLAQNVDSLYFNPEGQLHFEYERLFRSIFKKAEKHFSVVRALSAGTNGLTRKELIEETGLNDGGASASMVLSELEQCGFISKSNDPTKAVYGARYRLVDPFLLFNAYVSGNRKISSWTSFTGSPGFYSWRGTAFELVSLLHISQIKNALGILGVESVEYSFRSTAHTPGAQIDLLIDRNDNVINLCEMKFTNGEFRIDETFEKNLLNKKEAFVSETKTNKSIHLTMVTAGGLQQNRYSGIIQNTITADDLFK